MAAAHAQVRRALPQDRQPLSRMLELYQHDMSDIWDQDLDLHGEYGYPLDRYWLNPDCHPFVAMVNERYAGFALVDAAVRVGREGRWVDQFFVLKKYRRAGVGRALAHSIFDALPGAWEMGQMLQNEPAQSFWRRVIAEYTGGAFTEQQVRNALWIGPVQCFRSTAAHRRLG